MPLLGGREGWLGRHFFVPSIQEQADARHLELERRRLRLELDQEEKARANRQLEKRIKRLWAEDRKPEARQAVHDLRRGRVEYTRIGRQKANVAAVTNKIDQLRHGTATEDALEFYVVAMADRMATTHPERFAHVLERCSRLQSMHEMTSEMLDEFFADEEQAEREREADDECDEDAVVNDVLIELKIIRGIDSAPSLKEVDGAIAAASSDKNDGDGGGGAGAAPMLRADEHDVKPPPVSH